MNNDFHMTLIKEKAEQASRILDEKNIDLWLTFVRESDISKDPVMDTIVGTNVTWQTAFLIDRKGNRKVILGSLDAANMKEMGVYPEVITYVQSVKDDLLRIVKESDPQSIAINYSRNSNHADGLTHGMYLILQEYFSGTPYLERFVSSEGIIASLKGRKSATEIAMMKEAVRITLEIYDETTQFIKPGRTEKEVAAFITEQRMKRGLEAAWDIQHCPAVFTGPESAGAHAGPTDRVIEKGHLINTDFGVRVNGYCSDLQRTWYILKDDEDTAPAEVQRGFDVLLGSIRNAKKELRPGKTGCEIDDAARNHITANGYEEYMHGLGHQVGKNAHDGGAGLFPRWERYGNLPYLPIEESQVFTIEPRLYVPGYGIVTIEEMVQVTKDGCEYLSAPQEELYLVR